MGFIYLIWTTKYKLKNMNIYKVGRTEQKELLKRLRGYGKLGEDYFILYYTKCDLDSQIMEKQIIEEFKEHFLLYEGNEWFMGDSTEMINIIKNQNKKQIVKTDTKEEMEEIRKEFEQIRKDVKEKDEEIKEKDKLMLRHIVRYNILKEEFAYIEESQGIKEHSRIDFHYSRTIEEKPENIFNGDETLDIFDNMFKWLEELNYFEYIRKKFYNISLKFITHKGGIWLSIEFENYKYQCCGETVYNLSNHIFDNEYTGTNQVINTIVEIIATLNYKIKNDLRYSIDFVHHPCNLDYDDSYLSIDYDLNDKGTSFTICSN